MFPNDNLPLDQSNDAEGLLYHSILESLGSIILVIDLETACILDANQAACSFYGYSLPEFLNKKIDDLVVLPPDELWECTRKIPTQEIKQTVAVTHRLANGETRTVESYLGWHFFKDRMTIIAVIHDISAREKAEIALRESEERYRLLVETSQDAILLTSLDGSIQRANRAATTIFGWSEDEIYQGGRDLFLDSNDPAVISALEIRECTGRFVGELTFRRKDGSQFPAEVSSVVYRDTQGHARSSMFIHDISQRKKAQTEIALQASLLEQVHNGVIAIDNQNIIIYWNKYAEELYLWTCEEAVGKNIIDLLAPEEMKETVYSNFASLNRDGHWEGEFNVKRKDGTTLPAHITNSYLKDINGHNIGFIGISVDITERKRAEAALLESEQRFSVVFHDSHDAISILRLSDGVYLDVNDAYCAAYEVARDKVIGHFAATLSQWKSREQINLFWQNVSAHKEVSDYEIEFETASGKSGYMLVSGKVVQISGQECVLVFSRDITMRKQAEVQLQAAHNQLEKRVQERTAELSIANQSLERALHIKDAFLAAMSHELRTPLTGILGLTEALQMPHYGPLTEKQTRAVGGIEKSGQRLLAVVNDVLDYSLLQSGGFSSNPHPCNLNAICQKALQDMQQQMKDKRQQARFTSDPEQVELINDERHLLKILKYLLDNASKFTAENGDLGIEVVASQATQQVRLTVWDAGIGIQEADLPRLFQPFVQLDANLSRQYEGTGLGLVLVKEFAHLISGSVAVESVVGQGSRFTITLPWIH